MRVWDQVPPENLCRKHLLGEHREIHCIWSILSRNSKGYANHPEVVRWKGRKAALYKRHQAIAEELINRGYNHRSPLRPKPVATINGNPLPWDNQLQKLKDKECECRV